jgi:hypothetical protein
MDEVFVLNFCFIYLHTIRRFLSIRLLILKGLYIIVEVVKLRMRMDCLQIFQVIAVLLLLSQTITSICLILANSLCPAISQYANSYERTFN